MSWKGHWSTQQLAEFLAAVFSYSNEEAAIRGALERAVEALDAELGVIVREGAVVAAVGFGLAGPPADGQWMEPGRAVRAIGGLGPCAIVTAPIEDAAGGMLLVGRLGDEPFAAEELHLLSSMGRVLALTLVKLGVLEQERTLRERSERQAEENVRLLACLQERQRLFERLSRIQRSISHRAELDSVLDAIVAGAGELLGDEVMALRLIDPDDPSSTVVASSSGMAPDLLRSLRRARVGEGAGGRAIAERRLVVMQDYGTERGAIPDFAAAGNLSAAMAAPVHEHGDVVGSLGVGTREPGRSYSKAEQEILMAFAEHASLALSDARTVEAMHAAFHDPLTGLANRALFLDRFEHRLSHAERDGGEVTVLFLDLDRFKLINDSLGHTAGDEVLVAGATRLRECLREADTPARLGGDEFAVLLEDNVSEAEAGRLAERVIAALEEPFVVQGKEVFLSASVGIAAGRRDAEDLLCNADVAMYHAKKRSSGGYELYRPGMRRAKLERLELESDLQRAVENEEFAVLFQPIVDLRTGGTVGAEALVRWAHPGRGLVSPGAFIPLAEETGLIMPLGRLVLDRACAQAAHWRHNLPVPVAVNVNLSARQLQDPGLVDHVGAALARHDLEASALVLEVTETVLVQEAEVAVDRLADLRALGVGLALDDFGTGYSSLRYLSQLPVDVLKVDKCFVDGLGSASGHTALVRAVVEMAGSLDLRVVAEGIERTDQAATLVDLGCELGQGFHFARPLDPVAMAERLLTEASRSAAAAALPLAA